MDKTKAFTRTGRSAHTAGSRRGKVRLKEEEDNMGVGRNGSSRRQALPAALALTLFFIAGVIIGPEGGTAPVRAANSVEPPMVPASFSQLAEMVGPAVVNIRTVKTL